MATVPLVVIPEERRQRELRRAIGQAGIDHRTRRSILLLALVCLGWWLLGLALLGLSFHMTDPDRAPVAFLTGILVGNAGPAWTVIIWYWLENQR